MAVQKHRLDTVRLESNLIVAACPTTLIPILWDRVEPFLMKPIERSNEVSIETVRRDLESGECLLLTVSDGPEIIAVVTAEVRVFATGVRALYLPLIGGSRMDEWMDRVFAVAKAIAKDLNCTELRGIAVRKGWLRALKDMGWSEVSTIIKCDVGE